MTNKRPVLSHKAPPIPRPTFSRIDILSVPNASVIFRHSSVHLTTKDTLNHFFSSNGCYRKVLTLEIRASFLPSCQALGIVCIPHFPLSTPSLSMSLRRFSGLTGSSGSAEPSRELFEACRSGDLERVKKLVCPENVNSRDTAGRKSTPLHFAAGEYHCVIYSILFYAFYFLKQNSVSISYCILFIYFLFCSMIQCYLYHLQ